MLLRANPAAGNWSLSGPILTIASNHTTVNGLVLEGTAGLPNAPNCSCSTTKQGDCSGMCHFLQVGVTLDLSTSGTDVLGVVAQNCVTYHNNHAGYKTPGHASTGPGSTLEWTLRANVVFQTGNSEVGGAASGLDHGFYTHANRGLVLDGNVGYDIAGWGIHAYAGGPGSNGTVFTRNLFFRCETGAFLTDGFSNLIANNLFASSATGVNLYRSRAQQNVFVNNLIVGNGVEAIVDARGGKCGCEGQVRVAFPYCGPKDNSGSHNAYGKAPTGGCESDKGDPCFGVPGVPRNCSMYTAGSMSACFANCHPTGCCSQSFPRGAGDSIGHQPNVTVRAWGAVEERVEVYEVYDGRLRPDSGLGGKGIRVEGMPPWLPAKRALDIGAFP